MTTYQSTSAQSISPAQSFSPAQSPSPGQEPGALTATVPDQGKFTAGGLTRHVHEWSLITDDYITLQAVRGVLLPLIGKPPTRRPSQRELDERREDQVIGEAIKVVVFSDLVLSLILSHIGVVTPKSGPRGPQGRRGLSQSDLYCPKDGMRKGVWQEIYTEPQSE